MVWLLQAYLVGLLIVLLVTVCAAKARAQNATFYLQGGGLLTTQSSDTSYPDNPSIGMPGVGGTAWGVVAGLGIRNRIGGIAAEFSLPARFETV